MSPSEPAPTAAVPGGAGEDGRGGGRSIWNRLSLRHFLFALLLMVGILPLILNSVHLIRQFTQAWRVQEAANLSLASEYLSQSLGTTLAEHRNDLDLLGHVLLSDQESSVTEVRSATETLVLLRRFAASQPGLVAVRALDREGVGPELAPPALGGAFEQTLDGAFEAARASRAPVYRFVSEPHRRAPHVAIAVPQGSEDEPALWIVGLFHLARMEEVFAREAQEEGAVFLIDDQGRVLWHRGAPGAMVSAFAASELVRDFVRYPLNMTREYTLEGERGPRRMVGRVSPIAEPSWGVVVQRPAARSFASVRRMVWNTGLSTALLVLLALIFAMWAARQLSRPIQQMAVTSSAIAGGDFGQRVDPGGPGAEILQLGRSFNRMSEHVEEHVERLRRAAKQNEQLFLGTVRSFAAAIDAKDPYTRGHSERVAAYTRAICEQMNLSPRDREVAWIGALLHDVGKIGVDDDLLRKSGRLTDEEFATMKRHPAIGADILHSIEQLESVLPIVRWHHENWNGGGYPDGLAGESIPLLARIVAVADTFDALTTHRPYQSACTIPVAIETLLKLVDRRFDAQVVTAFLQAHHSGRIEVEGGDFTDLEAATRRAAAIS